MSRRGAAIVGALWIASAAACALNPQPIPPVDGDDDTNSEYQDPSSPDGSVSGGSSGGDISSDASVPPVESDIDGGDADSGDLDGGVDPDGGDASDPDASADPDAG